MIDESNATAAELLAEAGRIAALAAARDEQQLTAADAEQMTPEQIVAAKKAGRFDQLLKPPPRPIDAESAARLADTSRQLTADDLEHMSAEQIVQAKRAGRCDSLLGRPAGHPRNLY